MKATLSSVRIAPRKLSLVADQVRGKPINEAITYLKMSPRRKSSDALYNLLKSAAANADQKGTVDVDKLFVKTILVNEGPTLKRWMPRAKGSASPLHKRTSHVKIELGER